MISPDEDQAKTTKDDRLRSEEVQINVYEFCVSQILIMRYMYAYILIIVQIPVARSKLQVQEQPVHLQ